MKKGRIIGVLTLALSLIIGIPVNAEGNNTGLTLELTGPTGMTGTGGTSAIAGDTLTFQIKLGGVKGNTGLGGSHLRFQVTTTPDVDDANGRIGEPEMTTTCTYMPDGSKGTGVAAYTLSADIADLDGDAEAVVTLPVTDAMKGKTLYYKVDLHPDFSADPAFVETEVMSISVEDDENQGGNPEITITTNLGADINKLEKGKTFPIELTVTNPNEIDLPHVYVAAGYSESSMFDENGDETGVDPDPLGTFTELPTGVTQPETGIAYLPTLTAGSSVTLKVNAVIPGTYAKDSIVLSYMAVSFEDENQESPVTGVVVETNGKIAKATSDLPQEPGTSNPGAPSPGTPNPGVQPSGQNVTGNQAPAVKKAAPRTGDTMPAAGTLAVCLGAIGVISVISRKRIAEGK